MAFSTDKTTQIGHTCHFDIRSANLLHINGRSRVKSGSDTTVCVCIMFINVRVRCKVRIWVAIRLYITLELFRVA